MLVFKHSDKTKVENLLAAINQVAILWNQSEGRTVDVVNGVSTLIGTNVASGENEFGAVGTSTWDDVKQASDGEWYIISPTNSPYYVDWKDYLPLIGFTLDVPEVEYQLAWNIQEPMEELP